MNQLLEDLPFPFPPQLRNPLFSTLLFSHSMHFTLIIFSKDTSLPANTGDACNDELEDRSSILNALHPPLPPNFHSYTSPPTEESVFWFILPHSPLYSEQPSVPLLLHISSRPSAKSFLSSPYLQLHLTLPTSASHFTFQSPYLSSLQFNVSSKVSGHTLQNS